MARLGDVCIINPKDKIEDSELEVSFVPMQRVSENGDIDSSETRKVSEVCKGFTSFCEGDVLMAKITPCMENGKGAVARNLCNGCGFGSTEFFVIRPDQEKVLSEWLYYFTANKQFRLDCERNMTGSAGQKRVPKTYLEGCEIPVPPIEKQQEYVGNLDRISELIKMREKQIKMLDDLVKSQFIEMFGDGLHGNEKFPMSSMKEVCSVIQDGEHSTVKRVEEGHLFLSARNVKSDHNIVLEPVTYVDDERFAKIRKRFAPQTGDVLLTCAGTIGNAAIVPDMEPFVADRGVTMIRPQTGILNSQYLLGFFSSAFAVEQMRKSTKATALAHLYLKQINELRIMLPPIDLQNRFADFVEQSDKSKFSIQQSLKELETLKKSLMQQYFG